MADNNADDDDQIMFPSRLQKGGGGGWGSTSQRQFNNPAQDDAEDEILFPSRVNKQGNNANQFNPLNRPATSQMTRHEEENHDRWRRGGA